jgi:hypothetical protein
MDARAGVVIIVAATSITVIKKPFILSLLNIRIAASINANAGTAT